MLFSATVSWWTAPGLAASRARQDRDENLERLDALGPDDVAGQPVGALGPVVAVVLDAGLEGDDVFSGRPHDREVGRRYLEYLAHLVGVALAERVLEEDLVAHAEAREVVEDAVANGAGVTEPVAGYVGVGALHPREARARHVANALRQDRLGGPLQNRNVLQPDRGYGQIHGGVCRDRGGCLHRPSLAPLRRGLPFSLDRSLRRRLLPGLLRGRLPGARHVGSLRLRRPLNLLVRVGRRGGLNPPHRPVLGAHEVYPEDAQAQNERAEEGKEGDRDKPVEPHAPPALHKP